MYSDLDGKVALVTGSGQGIGRAIALALAAEGVGIAVNVRDSVDAGNEVVREIEEAGGKARLFKADVGDEPAAARLADEALEHFGRIDILVNNAGSPSALGVSLGQIDTERWNRSLNINVNGTFYCCRALGDHMLERGSGAIINISSLAALKPLPLWGSYSVSKAAVSMLTRQLALEWAGGGVRVNGIAPGLTARRHWRRGSPIAI